MVQIELSIAETNKLRAQLGLPLIPDGNETPENLKNPKNTFSARNANTLRKSLGLRRVETDFGEERAENEAKAEKSEEKQGKIAFSEPKNSDMFYTDVDSTDSWLSNLGKPKAHTNTKTEARMPPEESFEPEIRLAHDSATVLGLRDGDVLTLEDRGVVDDEEDVLANDELAKVEKDKLNKLEKKREDAIKYGARRGSEEAPAPAKSSVSLRGNMIVMEPENLDDLENSENANSAKKLLILLDFDDLDRPRPPVVMKKKAKSKKSNKRQREVEIEISEPMVTQVFEPEEESDDELESMLARSRSQKQQRRKLMSAEEIANEILMHLKEDMKLEISGGILYDDTKDFLDSLQVGRREEKKTGNGKGEEENTENSGTELKQKVLNGSDDVGEKIHQESPDDAFEKPQREEAEETEEQDAAPKFSSLLDTLKYLRQSNQVSEESQAEKLHRRMQRDAELNRIKISIEERVVKEELAKDHNYMALAPEEQEKAFDRVLNERLVSQGIITQINPGKYSRYNNNSNSNSKNSSRNQNDTLAGYDPKVSLRYTDKSGQVLDTKQAWKELLHKYHGLEPKNKKRKAGQVQLKKNVIH